MTDFSLFEKAVQRSADSRSRARFFASG